MKGLLKNNFFTTCANAKVFSVFMLLLGIFVVAVVSPTLLFGYMLLGMIGFSVNALASIKNEFSSKWGRYKLTLPVKRADIIKSNFMSRIIWLFVGTLFAGVGMGLSRILHGCPFDRYIDVFTMFALGISISLFMGAVFFPLLYLGSEERSEVFMVIALLCAVGIDLMIVSITNKLLELGTTTILLGAAALLVLSLLAFSISYPITVGVFKRKEY